MIVDEQPVVETKATHEIPRMATRQLYNYLCATNLELGLRLHFGPEPKFCRVFRARRARSTCRPRSE
jgi:hypothetical protein